MKNTCKWVSQVCRQSWDMYSNSPTPVMPQLSPPPYPSFECSLAEIIFFRVPTLIRSGNGPKDFKLCPISEKKNWPVENNYTLTGLKTHPVCSSFQAQPPPSQVRHSIDQVWAKKCSAPPSTHRWNQIRSISVQLSVLSLLVDGSAWCGHFWFIR